MRNRIMLAMAASALATLPLLTAAPAQADPTFVPEATDLVGVGSDTTQFAMNYLADGFGSTDGYNEGRTDHRLVSFDATGGGTIVLQSGHTAVSRPNGSGAGKSLLYGAGNNTDIDYARSSSAISATEASNGLWAFPFAKDTMVMTTAPTTNAPTALTGPQIVQIYSGAVTNWSDLGGTAGTIKPLVPQTGSGTRSFFLDQLKSLNGGTSVTLGANVVEAQEHDDTLIKNDPNAVAPFSEGRADLLGTLRVETGWSAARGLYNVVRQADVNNADVLAVFGPSGFVCSTAARPLIEAAGFDQLATSAHGGVCGQATQSASSNLTINQQVVTTTQLTLDNSVAGELTATAEVAAGATLPDGDVEFYVDGSGAASATVTLVQGSASTTLTGLSAGSHTVVAKYVAPEASAYDPSQASQSATVKSASTTVLSAAPAVTGEFGIARTVTASVTAGATGDVEFTVDGGAPITVAVVNGSAELVLDVDQSVGTHDIEATYLGDADYAGSDDTIQVVVTKATSAVTESFPAKVAAGAKAKGTIVVDLPQSTEIPSGKVKITRNGVVLAKGTLSPAGQWLVTLPKLPKGTNNLVVAYAGSGSIKSVKLNFVIVQK